VHVGGRAQVSRPAHVRPLFRTESLRPPLRSVLRAGGAAPQRSSRSPAGARAALRGAARALLPHGARQLVQLLRFLGARSRRLARRSTASGRRRPRLMSRPSHAVGVRLVVPFHDCDPLFVAWHGRYLQYLEIARTALMKSRNLDVPDLIALRCRMFVTEAR